jgi:hypothetical protein
MVPEDSEWLEKSPVSGREPTRGEERELLSGCFEAEASGRTQLPSANRPIVDNVPNCDPDSQSQEKIEFELANS